MGLGWAQFFFNPDSPFYIGDLSNVEFTISVHSYHSVWPVDEQVTNRSLVNMAIKMANPNLAYWMSEYCILQENDELGSVNGRDLGMKTALYVARIIHHDLVLTHARSWQWWTAISQVDYKDGLVYLDDGSEGETGRMGGSIESMQHDGAVRDSKLLWVLGNYSRFVRPGMLRIECEILEEQSPENGVLVSAYKDPGNGSLVYVFINLSRETMDVHITQDGKASTYTTDKDRNMGFKSQPLNAVILPARSVASIIKSSRP